MDVLPTIFLSMWAWFACETTTEQGLCIHGSPSTCMGNSFFVRICHASGEGRGRAEWGETSILRPWQMRLADCVRWPLILATWNDLAHVLSVE